MRIFCKCDNMFIYSYIKIGQYIKEVRKVSTKRGRRWMRRRKQYHVVHISLEEEEDLFKGKYINKISIQKYKIGFLYGIGGRHEKEINLGRYVPSAFRYPSQDII